MPSSIKENMNPSTFGDAPPPYQPRGAYFTPVGIPQNGPYPTSVINADPRGRAPVPIAPQGRQYNYLQNQGSAQSAPGMAPDFQVNFQGPVYVFVEPGKYTIHKKIGHRDNPAPAHLFGPTGTKVKLPGHSGPRYQYNYHSKGMETPSEFSFSEGEDTCGHGLMRR